MPEYIDANSIELDPEDDSNIFEAGSFELDEEESVTPKAKPQESIADKAIGVGEAAASAITGLASWIPGGIVKAAGLVSGQLEEGSALGEEVQRALTYEPKTEAGQRYAGHVSTPFEWLSEKAQEAGDVVYDKTGSALLGTAARTTIEAVPFIAPALAGRGLRGAKSLIRMKESLAYDKPLDTPTVPVRPTEGIRESVETVRPERPVEKPIEIPTEPLREAAQPEAKVVPAESVKLDDVISPDKTVLASVEKAAEIEKIEPAKAEEVAPERTVEVGEGRELTGIKNAQTLAEREARGLSEVEVETRRSNQVAFDEAMRRIESGEVDPRLLAEELAEKPRSLTPEESAILIIDRQKIKTQHKEAMNAVDKTRDSGDAIAEAEARANLMEVEELYNKNDVAARLTGYEEGSRLQARKMMIDEDLSLAAMVQRYRVATGKPVTPEMRAKFESLSKQLEEANAKLKAHEERSAGLETEKSIEKLKIEVAKEERQAKRAYTKQELSTEFDGLVKDLNKVLGGQLNVGIDPTAALILGKMAKNRVKAGVVTVDGIVDEVYTAVKSMGVEISKRDIRDAISGYGITSKMSQDSINVQLRELKRQMRLVSALEDAQAKQVPLRSGLQRDVPSDTVRALQRQVKQVMRESGIDSTKARSPEEQWKTSLDAVKSRLKNSIADVTKEIETGERTTKNKGIVYDAEANALKEYRDTLAKLRDALDTGQDAFSLEKPGELPVAKKRSLSPEQRVQAAVKAAERAAGEYARRVAENDLATKKTSAPPLETPELVAARRIRDEWKGLVEELRKEANPPKTPEEIALKSFKTRTINRIADLERRLATGDFTKKPKREIVPDKEALDLMFNRDKVIKAYNEAVLKDQLVNRTALKKVGGAIGEAVNLSRSIKTSMDLSAVLRQGAFIAFGHPIRAAKSIPAMFKALRSEKGQYIVEQEIANRPNAKLYDKSKLFLSKQGIKLSDMEEVYMSRLANKIPGVGASQRAYTTFLNKLRADSFDSMVANLTKDGKPTQMEMDAIANFINVATGRGKMGMRENTLAGLNVPFFAPRYVASRFQYLLGQPFYKGNARTRMMIANEYARFLAGLGTVYALGRFAGADIEIDPRSSDFGKMRFGNTRIDPLAGLSQTTVLLSRLISGETKTGKGKIVPIRGDKVPYGSGNSADIMARFLRSKLSPVVGMGVDILTGKDVVGGKITAESIPERLLMPLAFDDIYKAMKENGIPAGTAMGLLSIFGMGLQAYQIGQRNDDTIFDTIRQDFLGETPRGVRATHKKRRTN